MVGKVNIVLSMSVKIFCLNENLEFDIFTVRGIIIELADGREISFEKSIWFSEFITVKTGYELTILHH